MRDENDGAPVHSRRDGGDKRWPGMAGALALPLFLLAGCGDPSQTSPEPSDAGAGKADGATAQNFPAFELPLLTVAQNRDAVIAAPHIVPVFFQNDPDPTLAASVGDFLVRWTASPTWKQQVSEYGVGDATIAPAVIVTEDAPAITSDQEIAAWLAGQLDGSHRDTWATPDENSIYLLVYPPSTTITDGVNTSCKSYSGYHHSLPLGDAIVAARAVIPQCSPGTHTSVISHEIVETVTDKVPGRGYSGLAPPYSLFGGGELADQCDSRGAVTPADVGYPIQRTWSNAASLAHGDPCVPAQTGAPYFGAFPVLPDVITEKSGAMDAVVIVPPGQSRSIDVRLFSSGPLSGPFTVSVSKVKDLELTLKPTTGRNGDTIQLNVKNNGTATQGTASFSLTSKLGTTTHSFPGAVSFH